VFSALNIILAGAGLTWIQPMTQPSHLQADAGRAPPSHPRISQPTPLPTMESRKILAAPHLKPIFIFLNDDARFVHKSYIKIDALIYGGAT
jgi:hypothetical protein